MRFVTGIASLTAGVLLGTGELSAQVPGSSDEVAKNPACALLSAAEVRKITGRDDYVRPWSSANPGEGVAGGSACAYEGDPASMKEPPLIGFSLIEGKDYTQLHSTTKLPGACRREPVKGVGEKAYFECCPCSARNAPDLYVKVGSKDLIVSAKVEAPATEASMRPIMISLAQAVAAKLR
jgi:hypothetical protein